MPSLNRAECGPGPGCSVNGPSISCSCLLTLQPSCRGPRPVFSDLNFLRSWRHSIDDQHQDLLLQSMHSFFVCFFLTHFPALRASYDILAKVLPFCQRDAIRYPLYMILQFLHSCVSKEMFLLVLQLQSLWVVWVAQLLGHQAHDRKIVSRSPSRGGRRMNLSRVSFCAGSSYCSGM